MTGSKWRFDLLGRLRAHRDGQTLAHISLRRLGALLSCLVIRGSSAVPRDELISLLWPDDPVDAARNRLRVLLNNLKHHLEDEGSIGGSVLLANRTTVELVAGTYSSDYHEFHRYISKAAASTGFEAVAALESAVALYRGELLDGLSDEWIVSERRNISEVRYQALRDLVRTLTALGALDRASDYARQAVIAEPLDEEAHADLIELYASVGRPSAGLRQYDQLKRLLRSELNARPSERTREIAARLTSQLGHGVAESGRPVRSAAVRSDPVREAVPASRVALPMRLTRFFGREDEIEALTGMLSAQVPARLITLIGPGGTGKTRLALQVADAMTEKYCGRVYYVEMAEILDAATAPAALERALGLPPSTDGDLLSRVSATLSHGPALLVLDNLEQLVPEILPMISRLLAEAPSLCCLATSRRSLGVDGERELPIGPLPGRVAGSDINTLRHQAGVALFLDRASNVRGGAGDSDVAVRDAADICAALDGLPLAIELAAARARSMSFSEIKRQTSEPLDLLIDVREAHNRRHRSLRSTIDWSYRLLTKEEQSVFQRLTVFGGGFTMEAAVCVACGASDTYVPTDRFVLEQLCAASMITFHNAATDSETRSGGRFAMIETIREFGSQQLGASDQLSQIQALHFAYFAETFWGAERAGQPNERNSNELAAAIADDEANLRLALEFGLRANATQEQQRMAVSLMGRMIAYWETKGRWSEGAVYLSRALSLSDEIISGSDRLRVTLWAAKLTCLLGATDQADAFANAALQLADAATDIDAQAESHTCLGMAAFFRGDYRRSEYHHSEALKYYLTRQDRKGAAGSEASLANVAFYLGRDQEAIRRFQEALAAYRELGDSFGAASVLQRLGNAWRQQGNLSQGRRDLSEALQTFRNAGFRQGIAGCLHDLGLLLYYLSEFDAAYELFLESLELFREIGYRRGEAVCLYNLANLAIKSGETAAARSYLKQGVELSRRIGDRRNLASCLCSLGLLARLDRSFTESRAEYEAALAIETDIGSRGGISNCLTGLGRVALEVGDIGEARVRLTESLLICAEMGVRAGISELLEAHAELQFSIGNTSKAAQLCASASRLRIEIAYFHSYAGNGGVTTLIDGIRAAMGDAPFRDAWGAGELLTTEAAVALATD